MVILVAPLHRKTKDDGQAFLKQTAAFATEQDKWVGALNRRRCL